MKYFLLLIFSSLLFTSSKKQNFIVDKDVVLKPGFYRNFEEFKNNSPSIEFNYSLTQTPKGYGFMNSAGEVMYYRVVIDKTKAKSIGKVFGFCTGKNVYLCMDEPILKPKTDFVKVNYLGRYCYFEQRGIDVVAGVGPTGYSSKTYLQMTALDINTGKFFTLYKNNVREILANDPDLLEDFKNEKKKNKALKDYLISYSEKHQDEILR